MQDIDRKADTDLSGKELPFSWRECLSNTSKTVSLLEIGCFLQGVHEKCVADARAALDVLPSGSFSHILKPSGMPSA
jgi:hypothetical protein